MISAQLARSGYSTSSPTGMSIDEESGAFRVTGLLEGPGCGYWSCGSLNRNLVVAPKFLLRTSDMPSFGTTFVSSPTVRFTSGDIYGASLGKTTIPFADYSSLKCKLRIRQLLRYGGNDYAAPTDEWTLIDLGFFEVARYFMPPSFELSPISWELDRTSNLHIKVEIRFEMSVEGGSSIRYSWYPDSLPFRVEVPSWSITSSDSPELFPRRIEQLAVMKY